MTRSDKAALVHHYFEMLGSRGDLLSVPLAADVLFEEPLASELIRGCEKVNPYMYLKNSICFLLLVFAMTLCGFKPAIQEIKPTLFVQVPAAPQMEPWSEGPVWRNGELFFANRPFVRVTKEHKPLQYLNLHVSGTFLRSNGHLLVCEHFHRALLDIAPDDTVRVVAERDEQGKPLRGLNDVTADAAGNVYWTDPADSGVRNPTGRIYRLMPTGKVDLLADNLAFPNGIEVDPASQNLYVIESQTKKVLRYRLPKKGQKLGASEVFFDFGAGSGGGDGLCFDAKGNLWIAEFAHQRGHGQVVVVSPQGQILNEVVPGAKLVTNVTFGGDAGDELFMSTGEPSGIFHAKVGVKGFRGHPVPNLTLGRTLKLTPLNEPLSIVPDHPRYAELHIYHVLPGKTAALLEQLEAPLTELKRRHGLNPQAYWVSHGASTEAAVVELLAPPSAAAAEMAWKLLGSDPEFVSASALSESKHGKTYSQEEIVKLTAPATAWNLVNSAQYPSRIFDLRLYTCTPGKETAFRDRWRDHVVRLYQRHGMENLGWWTTTDREHPRVFVSLFAHKSLADINAAIAAYHSDPEWIAIEKATETEGKFRSGVVAYKLSPASFSSVK